MIRSSSTICILSSLLTICLTCLTPVTSRAELVAHYTFDDVDVDGDTVKDVSGNGLNGTKVNGGPVTGVPGRVGQAASFGGGFNNEDNHYVDLSDHVDQFDLGEGTLAAWVKPATAEEAGNTDNCLQDEVCHFTDVLTIFAASDSTQGSAELRWVVHTATSPFNPVGPGGAADGSLYMGTRGVDFPNHLISDVADDVNLIDGQWHHVAVTVDGDNFGTLYIDGSEVDSIYQSGEEIISFMGDILPDGPDTAGIGRNKDSTAGGGQWFYQGLIDDFRIYDEALSVDDIQALFEGQVTDPCDYNGDGVLDIGDLDLLVAEVKAGTNSPQLDVNADGLVDAADIKQYVNSPEKLNTYIGDADLNGEFNSGDLVSIFTAGKYETGADASWVDGDWDGDGVFGSGDLVFAFADGGYELGVKAPAAVPEPGSLFLLAFAPLGFRLARGRE